LLGACAAWLRRSTPLTPGALPPLLTPLLLPPRLSACTQDEEDSKYIYNSDDYDGEPDYGMANEMDDLGDV
jgi:hypothetical protein